MKLRRSTPEATPSPAPQPQVLDKPGGKGRPTPKRNASQPRRAITAAPTDRKEAARRLRNDAKGARAAQAQALASGDERNYGPMHAGKERALIRDTVDARRGFGWLVLPGMVVLLPILLLSSQSPTAQAYLNIPVFMFIGLTIWDYLGVRRRIKSVLEERYPTGTKTTTRLLVLYGVSRNNQWPSRRKPKPRVKVGDPIP